jgi:hypothetical protein
VANLELLPWLLLVRPCCCPCTAPPQRTPFATALSTPQSHDDVHTTKQYALLSSIDLRIEGRCEA